MFFHRKYIDSNGGHSKRVMLVFRGGTIRGHCITNPSKALLRGGNPSKLPYINCLIPHEMGSVMIPDHWLPWIRPYINPYFSWGVRLGGCRLTIHNGYLWCISALKHLETLATFFMRCISTYPSHSHGSVERDAPSLLKLPHLSDAWFLDEVYRYHFPSLRTSGTTVATCSYINRAKTPNPFFLQSS